MGDDVGNRTGHTGSFSTLISDCLHPEVCVCVFVCGLKGCWNTAANITILMFLSYMSGNGNISHACNIQLLVVKGAVFVCLLKCFGQWGEFGSLHLSVFMFLVDNSSVESDLDLDSDFCGGEVITDVTQARNCYDIVMNILWPSLWE